MARSLKRLLSTSTFSHLRYAPRIALSVRNWPTFIRNYALLQGGGTTYFFRDGLRLQTREDHDAATIAVVFFKHEYGRVPPGSTVVDIGANIGAFSLYSAFTAPDSRIFAYEPMPENFAVLRENIALNGLDGRINAFPYGVAGKKEVRELYVSQSPYHSFFAVDPGQARREINCVTLDDIFNDNGLSYIDLLKIDCEGAEYEIFYGSSDDCLAGIGEIRMEYHNQADNQNRVEALEKFLNDRGFETVFFRPDPTYSGNIWLRREARPRAPLAPTAG